MNIINSSGMFCSTRDLLQIWDHLVYEVENAATLKISCYSSYLRLFNWFTSSLKHLWCLGVFILDIELIDLSLSLSMCTSIFTRLHPES